MIYQASESWNHTIRFCLWTEIQ